jgi:uncharacterized protein (UPF0210 family)
MHRALVALVLIAPFPAVAQAGSGPELSKPKVRAITAFVRLQPQSYVQQVSDALGTLRKAEAEFQAAGYEVETIRVTTQPLAELVRGMAEDKALAFIGKLDLLSSKEGFIANVGPALMHDGEDPRAMQLLARALSRFARIQGSAIIADEDGIHWETIHHTAELVKYVSEHTPRSQGTFNFSASAMLKPLGPFFPGSYHTGPGREFTIGFESANVVREVFIQDRAKPETAAADLSAALTRHARLAEALGNRVATETGWNYRGLDPTPAPLGDASIAAAIEALTGVRFGSSGTLTAARLITSAVKAVPVKQVGYSGLMLPIMEDKLLAQRWAESTYSIDSLLAYSAVCGTGLDTIPLPGEISLEQMERIFADVASLAVKWNKPLSARLQPVANKKPGDRTDFEDPYLSNTMLHPLP